MPLNSYFMFKIVNKEIILLVLLYIYFFKCANISLTFTCKIVVLVGLS